MTDTTEPSDAGERDALIGSAYEVAASRVEANRAHLNFTALLGLFDGKPLPEPIVIAVSNWFDGIAAAIRNETPADATAALDRIRAEAELSGWKRGRDDAAGVASDKWGEGPSGSYDNGATQDGWNMCSAEVEASIRALALPADLAARLGGAE